MISSLFSRKAQGQAWSTDLIIASIIFILVAAVFYTLLVSRGGQDRERLEIEARTLEAGIKSRIIKDNKIDSAAIEEIFDSEYPELKSQQGVDADFCIFIEDQNGNLVPVGDKFSAGPGSEELQVGGINCGQPG